MQHNHGSRGISPVPAVGGFAFDIQCEAPAFAHLIAANLKALGFRRDPSASITVLLDEPVGFALRTLERTGRTHNRVIVATANSCPEYLADLWDLRPAVLLANACLDSGLAQAIMRASKGERYHIPSRITTPLTEAERRALRELADGLSDKEIAAKLGKKSQSIRTVLSSAYEKLGLKNRDQALLYYWGVCRGAAPGHPQTPAELSQD